MSIRWIDKVWRESPHEGKALLLHLAMADFSADDGDFFGSQTVLAKKARCSVEFVRQTIEVMVAAGHLTVTKRGSSVGRATEYRLHHWAAALPPVDLVPHIVGENPPSAAAEPPNLSPPPVDLVPHIVGENPPSAAAEPPNLSDEPPNPTRHHPSLQQQEPNGPKNSPTAGAPGDAEVVSIGSATIGQRVNRLAKAYTDHPAVAFSNFPAVAAVVRKAVTSPTRTFSDAEITDALTRLALDGRPVTTETLRIELVGLPDRQPPATTRNGGLTAASLLALANDMEAGV